MNYTARHQPLPYVRLARVYQMGDTCQHCQRPIPQNSEVLGDKQGFFCNEKCHTLYAIHRQKQKVHAIGFACLLWMVVILVAFVMLEVR